MVAVAQILLTRLVVYTVDLTWLFMAATSVGTNPTNPTDEAQVCIDRFGSLMSGLAGWGFFNVAVGVFALTATIGGASSMCGSSQQATPRLLSNQQQGAQMGQMQTVQVVQPPGAVVTGGTVVGSVVGQPVATSNALTVQGDKMAQSI